ncbi:tRNA pseudouridine(55) synthase TruB [Babesia caballi]|uniref:tRNA pseudouridine(55) synthase TruB n=1 Tax=Babesia caballi TaxID=5871 RepID=A0AAV4LL34_BABCB|nr:tRNA pseudouridine(55) synthase TruB [Babesia caballi]
MHGPQGQRLKEAPWQHVTETAFDAAIQSMHGAYDQFPPLYSGERPVLGEVAGLRKEEPAGGDKAVEGDDSPHRAAGSARKGIAALRAAGHQLRRNLRAQPDQGHRAKGQHVGHHGVTGEDLKVPPERGRLLAARRPGLRDNNAEPNRAKRLRHPQRSVLDEIVHGAVLLDERHGVYAAGGTTAQLQQPIVVAVAEAAVRKGARGDQKRHLGAVHAVGQLVVSEGNRKVLVMPLGLGRRQSAKERVPRVHVAVGARQFGAALGVLRGGEGLRDAGELVQGAEGLRRRPVQAQGVPVHARGERQMLEDVADAMVELVGALDQQRVVLLELQQFRVLGQLGGNLAEQRGLVVAMARLAPAAQQKHVVREEHLHREEHEQGLQRVGRGIADHVAQKDQLHRLALGVAALVSQSGDARVAPVAVDRPAEDVEGLQEQEDVPIEGAVQLRGALQVDDGALLLQDAAHDITQLEQLVVGAPVKALEGPLEGGGLEAALVDGAEDLEGDAVVGEHAAVEPDEPRAVTTAEVGHAPEQYPFEFVVRFGCRVVKVG